MTTPELMTTAEVAEALRMNIKTVQKLAKKGKLPCTTIGGRVKFLREDINDIIYANYRKV